MTSLHHKNKRTAIAVLVIVAAMVGLSFAAVPLYSLFCRVTGFDGTPMISTTLPDHVLDRVITVSFDARVDSALPWDFKPERRKEDVKIGQQGVIAFEAANLSARNTTGTAVYNVTPEKAGKYFHKTQCFCFAEQLLTPGQTAQFPVMFYVDPALADDPEMDDVTDIALSYTFFAAGSAKLDQAIETYGAKKD